MVAAPLGLASCGGEEGDSPQATDGRATVAAIQEGFTSETGRELTRVESEYGGPPRLVFDDDGDIMALSPAEAEVMEEFGTFTIYVAEKGDPEKEFGLLIGESGKSTAPSDPGTVTLIEEVAAEPDADGIVWKKSCVRYSDERSLNTCSWTAFKRYGDNVLATWISNTGQFDPPAQKFDQVMSTVTGN